MTFTATRAGGYLTGTRLLGSEVTAIDNNVVLALDTRGGTYTQSSPIVFSGDAWTLEELNVSGDAVLGATSADALRINAEATFYTSIVVVGGAYATTTLRSGTTTEVGTALTVHGDATMGDSSSQTTTFNSEATFNADASFGGAISQTGASNHIETGGNLVAQGLLNVTGTGTIDGATTLGSTLAVAGGATISSGSSVPRRVLQMVDAPTTATWTSVNAIEVGGGAVLTANRALTLTSVGMPNGAEYRVFAHPSSTGFGATIAHAGGTLTVRYADGYYHSVDIMVVGETLRVSGGDFRAA